MKTIHLTRRHAELLLAGVIVARATSYLFSKLILEGMGMFNLLGVRFALAFALLFVLFFPRLKSMNRKTFIAGAVMGGIVGWLKAKCGIHEVITSIMLKNLLFIYAPPWEKQAISSHT